MGPWFSRPKFPGSFGRRGRQKVTWFLGLEFSRVLWAEAESHVVFGLEFPGTFWAEAESHEFLYGRIFPGPLGGQEVTGFFAGEFSRVLWAEAESHVILCGQNFPGSFCCCS